MAALLYCTKDTVKTRMAKVTTGDDALLTTICTQVNTFVESRTFRPIGPDLTPSYTLDGYDALEDGRVLLFPRGIVSLSAVTVAPYTGATPVSIPIGDIFLQPGLSQLEPGWPYTEVQMTDIPSTSNTYPYFPQGYNNIVFTGTFGWLAIPADLNEAAEVLAARAYLSRQNGNADESGGDDVGTWLLSLARKSGVLGQIERYQWKHVEII